MGDVGTRQIDRVLVGTTGADAELRRWLSARAARLVDLVPRPPRGDVIEVASVELERRTSGGWSIVEVPVDGPSSALHLAFRALAQRLQEPRTAVAPIPPEHLPPDAALLAEIRRAGLTPAVDLSRVQWVTAHAALVVGPHRVVTIPWPHADRDRALAGVIVDLDTVREDAPSSRWLRRVAAGHARPDPTTWALALCAGYLEDCTHHLAPLR